MLGMNGNYMKKLLLLIAFALVACSEQPYYEYFVSVQYCTGKDAILTMVSDVPPWINNSEVAVPQLTWNPKERGISAGRELNVCKSTIMSAKLQDAK